MSEQEYSAAITAVPSLDGTTVVWGWKAELKENANDKVQEFDFPGMFATSKEALDAGTKSLRNLVKSYNEVAIYEVDLYKVVEEEAPVEETKEETSEKDDAAPEGESADAEATPETTTETA